MNASGRSIIGPLLVLFCLSSMYCALSGTNGSGKMMRAFDHLPDMFQRQVAAIGNRLIISGKEQTIYEGVLLNAAGKYPVRIIHQLPGLIRLEGFKPGGAVISFDGVRAYGTSSRDDEVLLETFFMDMPEGMFLSAQRSVAISFLGHGFGPDPRIAPQYNGPRYDIYEVTGPIWFRKDGMIRRKMYYFDTLNGLLQSARYYDGTVAAKPKIQTRFMDWQIIDGSAYPDRIDRYEGGQAVFSFVAANIIPGPAVGVKLFQ